MPYTPATPTNLFSILLIVEEEEFRGGLRPVDGSVVSDSAIAVLGTRARGMGITLASQSSDELQISDEDIETVMSQADVSRSKAFTALKDNGNNVADAIMELTM